ncbi:type IV secretory system conjugative DNA transfer family protein, partial [Actinotignum timonense]|uniref:type IV secretory system conjugative DNA transfer family protein n=1 Tax=Actinotignum timonense TaxID=1870995 RepID=UPI002A821207
MTYILTILGLLLAFWSGNKVCFQVRSDIEAELPLTDILDRFYLDLLERPFHVSFHEIDAAVGLCLAAAIGLSALYQKTMKGTRRDGAEHGSARFATQAAIRPYRDKTYTNNLLFTRTERLSLDGRKTQRNLNALVVGGSGSGKSRYYVLPNLAQFNTSFAVTDPKGELYAQTRSHLEAAGYKVRCFNLVDFNLSATFNPLSYFKDARGEIDISILVENFISNTTGRKPATSSDFWEKAERALLTA